MSIILKFEAPPGKPVLRGHDHFWRVIRELDGRNYPWSIAEIRGLCGGGVDRSSIRDFVKRLVAGGYAKLVDSSRKDPGYSLLKTPIATPRLRRDGSVAVQGRGQLQMWNTIRGPMGRDGFTFADLALYASTATVEVKSATAASYVKHLAEAGYLACIRKAKAGRDGTLAVYRLKPAMMTGILPPLILRSQIVFDQNRGEAIGPVVAREVEP